MNHRVPTHLLAFALIAPALVAGPAEARRALVTVDARSVPWESSLNPRRAFGQGDGQKPVYIWGLRLVPGQPLLFTASGMITVPVQSFEDRTSHLPDIGDVFRLGNDTGPAAQPGTWGPDGQPYRPADNSRGAFGTFFPSYYMPTKNYPVRINALIGSFVNADGVIVGEPFKIGERAIVIIPKGACAITLGINAETFADNRGVLKVIINTDTPTVTVEDVPASHSTP